MRMILSGTDAVEVTGPDEIPDLLAGIGDGGFAILKQDTHHYVQAALASGGWDIELRAGSERDHVVAIAETPPAPLPMPLWKRLILYPTPAPPGAFDRVDVERIFTAYFNGTPIPADFRWRRLYASSRVPAQPLGQLLESCSPVDAGCNTMKGRQ